jgi:RND superfamily putative drug exporter
MPALMKLVGLRVLNKKERAAIGQLETGKAAIPEVSTKDVISVRHPWLTALATIAILLIAAVPAQSLRLGLPDGSSNPIESTSYKAYKLISENFGEGANGTLVVVAESAAPLKTELAQLEYQADAAEKMQSLDGVFAVVPSGISDDETKVLFQVIPTGGPNSEITERLVYDLRALDSDYGVTGLAAVNIDISKKLADALPLYLGTVLLLSLLLLILVFRSILVPLVASAGFLLSIFATVGLSVVVFQWGWAGEFFDIHDPGPLLSFLPTIAIGILFGLAMDYQLFLASGMREAYVHGKSPKEAINYGVHLSRSVVVAAALIMVTVFGGFVFSHEVMIRPIGFALAVGVLLDAFLVRLLLVPAVLALLGKAAWWMPKWLDRILPDVDVEGAKLERLKAH